MLYSLLHSTCADPGRWLLLPLWWLLLLMGSCCCCCTHSAAPWLLARPLLLNHA